MNNKLKSLMTDDDKKNTGRVLFALGAAWVKQIREKYGDQLNDEDEEFIKYLEEEET